MCGIIGICGHSDVSSELVFGLNALQHRGRDAAGVCTFNTRFHTRKGLGTVEHVLGEVDPGTMPGCCGLGHVRYATQGRNDPLEAQPFTLTYPFGLAMVHNGNVINFKELRRQLYEDHHRLVETSGDLELILYTFASELERRDLKNLTVDDIFSAVEATQRSVHGAYSTLTIIANHGFLAFNDPRGIRPMVLGKKLTEGGVAWAFASESTALDYLGYELVRDLGPGEAVYIDLEGQVHERVLYREQRNFCVFEYIYFSREDSVILGQNVASQRVRIGKMLAETFAKAGIKPDIVIDVPNSAYFFASGLAEELGLAYRRGLAKNPHMGRSFILPDKAAREKAVRQKMNPIKDVVVGRKVAVVDDSIVRGTTSRHLVRLLRESGATEVYFVSASPPLKHPCVYGIDMSIRREMIAAHYQVSDIARFIGAERVLYLPLEHLAELYPGKCMACFSGKYPTAITPRLFQEIEDERVHSKRD